MGSRVQAHILWLVVCLVVCDILHPAGRHWCSQSCWAVCACAPDKRRTCMQPAVLPDLPGELCGIWAYIQWEEAGCPNRSQADADAEYQKSIEARPALPEALNPSP